MTDSESADATDRVAVREAAAAELPAVMNVLDGAALETDAGVVRERIDSGDVLVAVSDANRDPDGDEYRGEAGQSTTVLGALVLEGDAITNVAVRPGRRGQGIGTALVDGAATRRDRLVAEFDSDVRPFYESLGFAVDATAADGRCRGVLDTTGRNN